MTRVIAGTAGGRPLRTPPGQGTRPTSDRVRESLFGSLEARLGGFDGLHVLDLYAGSGALGLEALSRGAASATLVEKDRRAAEVARANVRSLRLPGSASVRPMGVRRFLCDDAARPEEVVAAGGYDLVFCDPPYKLEEDELTADLTALRPLLAPEAVVVVERSSRSADPQWPERFTAAKVRRYGETALHLAVWEP
ncbi:16S rRNA (guanine(966)-N(2))-methyltransferase RsmD [Nocardioidaceae bacterium]|nr:16S rRNA (guanine(966)-N(2))-methyltransferase RsmD [Nocardioidaceae bacterium]